MVSSVIIMKVTESTLEITDRNSNLKQQKVLPSFKTFMRTHSFPTPPPSAELKLLRVVQVGSLRGKLCSKS